MRYSGVGQQVDQNFWPAFADYMLALVLILIIFIGSIVSLSDEKAKQRKAIESLQNLTITKLCSVLNASCRESSEYKGWKEIVYNNKSRELTGITIRNTLETQQFRFGDKILFQEGSDNLLASGAQILRAVGNIFLNPQIKIREIQIQGHADNTPVRGELIRYKSNLELAAARAITVFAFLRDSLLLDPNTIKMSANSFGEYFPVVRDESQPWTKTDTEEANNTEGKRAVNRRIEILIFFG